MHVGSTACSYGNGVPGGSAKQARDRRFQAILPLRGKILNVERRDDAALYKNNEISSLIVALGLDVKGVDISGLRYGKARRLACSVAASSHTTVLSLAVPCTAAACLSMSTWQPALSGRL